MRHSAGDPIVYTRPSPAWMSLYGPLMSGVESRCVAEMWVGSNRQRSAVYQAELVILYYNLDS